MFIGPYEHHSNELPWRESIADVVTIHEDADGHIDVDAARAELERYADRPLKIGSFSAASNVTGIVTDTHRITRLLHEHGALAFWDFAAAAPYVDIEMNPHDGDPAARKDAIFLSPHKFIGGPGTPGRARRRAAAAHQLGAGRGRRRHGRLRQPAGAPSTSPTRRTARRAARPAIIESIRAGLVFAAQGRGRRRDDPGARGGLPAPRGDRLARAPRHRGARQPRRRAPVDRVVRGPPARRAATCTTTSWSSILNDLFGIQSRGGCSCAGPYGHRLLGIDLERSHEFEREITGGCEGIKPGWVRINFNYFVSEAGLRVRRPRRSRWSPTTASKLAPQYRFDPTTGRWQHRAGPVEPPLRLTHLSYDADGVLTYPREHDTAPESALADYLSEAVALFESLPERHLRGRRRRPGQRRLRAPALVRPARGVPGPRRPAAGVTG